MSFHETYKQVCLQEELEDFEITRIKQQAIFTNTSRS